MKITKNVRILAGSAALAVAFLGGIALAPSLVAPAAAQLLGQNVESTTDLRGPGGADLFSAAAQYIGISVDQLRTEMGTDKSMADVAVAHGKTRDGLVQALTTAAQQNLAQRIGDLVDQKGTHRGPGGPGGAGGPGMHGRGGPGFGFGFAFGKDLDVAANYIGISTADLEAKLHAGQSLAQIATAAGKTPDGLIQAIVSDETAKIDQAVTSGKLTADQATKIKSNLTQMVTTMVNNTHPMGGPGTGFGPRGPRPSASPAQSQ